MEDYYTEGRALKSAAAKQKIRMIIQETRG